MQIQTHFRFPSKLSFTCITLFFLLSVLELQTCHGSSMIFSFKMHHRFSEPLKKWSWNAGKMGYDWPVKGSFRYYAELAERDRILRGRSLSETVAVAPLVFEDGNSTSRINSLGFLHYTTVQVGTPGTKFLVALDTGSDLFWVPCDCNKCAPIEGTTYAPDFDLSIYYPEGSSTSKRVTCDNSLCMQRDRCHGTRSNCPYVVSYVSAETSTSGILVEDVLHLKSEDGRGEYIEAYITFGCGQVQTGSFLDIAAPNGLFGLGMEKISVPSILSREGIIADSFSMCFGHDGIGRINFGDKGSPDQEETPFNINPLHPTYNVSVVKIRIGSALIRMNSTALFDSGTSFTYLKDPVYTRLSKSFNSQVQDRRRPQDSRIPFEYCYDMSPDANASSIPSMSLTMKGGSKFAVLDPIIVISTQTELVYCLAVVKSIEMNIIGQNFMTGYRVVFDREKYVLGWKRFNCYDMEDYSSYPSRKRNTTVPAAIAAGVGETTTPRPKESEEHCESSDSAPSYCGLMWYLSWFRFFLMSLLFFLIAIMFLPYYSKFSILRVIHL